MRLFQRWQLFFYFDLIEKKYDICLSSLGCQHDFGGLVSLCCDMPSFVGVVFASMIFVVKDLESDSVLFQTFLLNYFDIMFIKK